MIDLAQLFRRLNVKGAHEVRHVVLISPAGAGALAARQPDLFFRNGGELVNAQTLDRSPT
jgi:hypothetical protein